MKELLIDCHVHLTIYKPFAKTAYDFFASAHPTKEQYEDFCKKYYDSENFLELMDKNGVDYSVVLAEITPLSTGIASNEAVEAFCHGNPRLIPFCTFNPFMHPNMGKQLEDLVVNHGFKGLKLYPNYTYFYPNDNFMYPLYAVAERLGIPVMFHTGTSIFENSRLKYSNPICLDDVAIDFPDMKIIMAHGGRGPWYDEALTLARLHRNVYIDVSGLPPQKLLEYFPIMDRFADKFVFGTDWPSVDVKKNADIIMGLGISEESKRKILGENAKKLLNL